jgi:hypothetical protein
MDQLYASHASSEDQHVTIGRRFFLRHIPPEGAGCPRGKDKAAKEFIGKNSQSLMRVTLVSLGVSAYRSGLLKLDGERPRWLPPGQFQLSSLLKQRRI